MAEEPIITIDVDEELEEDALAEVRLDLGITKPELDETFEALRQTASGKIQKRVGTTVLNLGEKIRTLRLQGVSNAQIRVTLIDDWQNGGPVFGGLRKSMVGELASTVSLSVNEGQWKAYEAGISPAAERIRKLRQNVLQSGRDIPRIANLEVTEAEANRLLAEDFLARGVEPPEELEGLSIEKTVPRPFVWICALAKTCRNCVVRHNVIRTFQEWTALGRPKSGFSVCEQFCECEIRPVATDDRTAEEKIDPIQLLSRDTRRKLVVQSGTRFDGRLLKSVQGRRLVRDLGTINAERTPEKKEFIARTASRFKIKQSLQTPGARARVTKEVEKRLIDEKKKRRNANNN